jgi:hypothetical protein
VKQTAIRGVGGWLISGALDVVSYLLPTAAVSASVAHRLSESRPRLVFSSWSYVNLVDI